jgi:hypothetical protein
MFSISAYNNSVLEKLIACKKNCFDCMCINYRHFALCSHRKIKFMREKMNQFGSSVNYFLLFKCHPNLCTFLQVHNEIGK